MELSKSLLSRLEEAERQSRPRRTPGVNLLPGGPNDVRPPRPNVPSVNLLPGKQEMRQYNRTQRLKIPLSDTYAPPKKAASVNLLPSRKEIRQNKRIQRLNIPRSIAHGPIPQPQAATAAPKAAGKGFPKGRAALIGGGLVAAAAGGALLARPKRQYQEPQMMTKSYSAPGSRLRTMSIYKADTRGFEWPGAGPSRKQQRKTKRSSARSAASMRPAADVPPAVSANWEPPVKPSTGRPGPAPVSGTQDWPHRAGPQPAAGATKSPGVLRGLAGGTYGRRALISGGILIPAAAVGGAVHHKRKVEKSELAFLGDFSKSLAEDRSYWGL